MNIPLPETAKFAEGEVVPMPTRPPLSIMKYVPDDDPTDNRGEFATPPEPSRENCAHGLDVPIPIRPFPFVPMTVNAGVVEP